MLSKEPTLAVYELYKPSIPSVFRNSLPPIPVFKSINYKLSKFGMY